MDLKPETKEIFNNFINIITKFDSQIPMISKSSFKEREKLRIHLDNVEKINIDKNIERDFISSKDYLIVIYLLLKSYDIFDSFSKINKYYIYNYLKSLDNIFDIDIKKIINELCFLDTDYDQNFILLITNKIQNRDLILKNLKDLEKKLNKSDLFLNITNNAEGIYRILEKHFMEKTKKKLNDNYNDNDKDDDDDDDDKFTKKEKKTKTGKSTNKKSKKRKKPEENTTETNALIPVSILSDDDDIYYDSSEVHINRNEESATLSNNSSSKRIKKRTRNNNNDNDDNSQLSLLLPNDDLDMHINKKRTRDNENTKKIAKKNKSDL